MKRIEQGDELRIKLEYVCLNKWKRIVGLRLDIDANNLKPCVAITDSGTPGAAEEIEQTWFAFDATT